MNVGSTGHEERGDGIYIFQHRPLYMERAEKTRSEGYQSPEVQLATDGAHLGGG